MTSRKQRRSFMSILGNLLGTNTTKESMTAYTITEAQRQQLLAATHTHYHKSYELLQSLTPNSGEPVAHGVFHKDGSAHIFQQQSTAQVFGEAQALYLHPAPSTGRGTNDMYLAGYAAGKLAAPGTSQRLGDYVAETATSHGWKHGDPEDAFTFMMRKCREVAIDDCKALQAAPSSNMCHRIRVHLANRYHYSHLEFCKKLEEILEEAAPSTSLPVSADLLEALKAHEAIDAALKGGA